MPHRGHIWAWGLPLARQADLPAPSARGAVWQRATLANAPILGKVQVTCDVPRPWREAGEGPCPRRGAREAEEARRVGGDDGEVDEEGIEEGHSALDTSVPDSSVDAMR